MPKLLVCQHVAFEILGTLNPLLKDAGFRMRYVNFGRHPHARPRLDGYHGLIVLGGPMNVDETDAHPHLDTEVELIREAIEADLPVLGICLGAQLIAKALGAGVRRNGEKEIGWHPLSPTDAGREDPLFRHFGPIQPIFQWHGDTFDIPDGAAHLATSPGCANQAFRYRRNVYGFQFHLEVDTPLIERWLRVPAFRDEIESLGGKTDVDRIHQDTVRHIDRTRQLADRTFLEFIKLFGERRRLRALPSR